ncbi:MAG TPA: hypothetical protein VGM51_03145 [Armatimonadota bacterium]|jgi:hypothetical protein
MSDQQLQPGDVRRLERYASTLYSPATWVQAAALVCILVGVIGFAAGLTLSPGRAWGAFLANFLFWTGLSMASMAMTATFNVSHAWWGRPIQRITAGLSAFTPVSLIALGILWFGRHEIFWWLGDADRSPWLQIGPLFIRDAAILAIASFLAIWSLRSSIRPDLGAMIEDGVSSRSGLAGWATRGWKGRGEEKARSMLTLKVLAPVYLLVYVFGMSILAIDLEMSLNPGFRSTMFPVIYWIGEYFGAFAAATILLCSWRSLKPLNELFPVATIRDLGNMLWGTSIFWAYVNWSQYFVIWMGNLPTEAAYVAARWRTQPWEPLAYTMLACSFIVPFALLFLRGLKRTPNAIAAIGALALAGILIQRFLDIFPGMRTLGPSDFGLVEVAVTIGFMGAVALPYLWLMRRVPVYPVEDPLFLRGLATRGVEV